MFVLRVISWIFPLMKPSNVAYEYGKSPKSSGLAIRYHPVNPVQCHPVPVSLTMIIGRWIWQRQKRKNPCTQPGGTLVSNSVFFMGRAHGLPCAIILAFQAEYDGVELVPSMYSYSKTVAFFFLAFWLDFYRSDRERE